MLRRTFCSGLACACFGHARSVSSGQDSAAIAVDESTFSICTTPQITKYDKIVGFGETYRPFYYNDSNELELSTSVQPGDTILMQNFQLALGRHAWRRSDALEGSTKSKLRLGIFFLDGSGWQRKVVEEAAALWTTSNGAPIDFVFGSRSKQNIRVSFSTKRNRSEIGRQAKNVRDFDVPTMSLGGVSQSAGAERSLGNAVHELGHALGLRHEHLHPEAGIIWDKMQVEADLLERNWSKRAIRKNIFRNLSVSYKCAGAPNHDKGSCMSYPIPESWTKNDYSVVPAVRPSPLDLACVKSLYE